MSVKLRMPAFGEYEVIVMADIILIHPDGSADVTCKTKDGSATYHPKNGQFEVLDFWE